MLNDDDTKNKVILHTIKSEIIANDENFDENAYLERNRDVWDVVKQGGLTAAGHFESYGKSEGRTQFNYKEIFPAREKKLALLDPILDISLEHKVLHDGTYDFLTDELRCEFKIFDTSNVSSNKYDYAGFENDPGCLILDCGAGFRPIYYDNVINYDIVNYLTTDVMGVGERLPFKDNSFDAVFSVSVLEHVKDPWRCAQEMCRVLKPGGAVHFHAAFMQPYHGFPSHYFNTTPSGAALLFEDQCDILSIDVPLKYHPFHSLHWFCWQWAEGLKENGNKESFNEFMDLKIKDLFEESDGILYKPALPLLQSSFVTELPEEYQKILAMEVVIVARKRIASDMRRHFGLSTES